MDTNNTTTLNDLAAVNFVHPLTNYDITAEFELDELYNSNDLQTAIDSGDLIFKTSTGAVITNMKTFIDSLTNPMQPYITTTGPIVLFHNTTANLVINGDNFDETLDIDLGPAVTINSISYTPTQLIINYTTGTTLQGATVIVLKKGNSNHFGETPTVEVTDVIIGTGSAGTFTTDFDTGTDSAARGTGWDLSIYGNVNSLDGYFQTQAYNTGTPSSTTGPDTSDVFGNGSGQYMYTEVSGSNNGAGQYGIARTSNFRDLTQLEFSYHMFGTAFGDFSLWSQNADDTRTQRRLVNGQQHANAGDPATDILLNTTTWDCKAIEFRFASPTNNTGYSADICIDDIILTSV